ncbi:MAG: hypothetical protein KBT53_04165 [Porticoccus sp.]|nr:hypothetical protein [Porticoccus sp.]
MTLIDILDTSIKIGLGAIITGVSSYYLVFAKQKSEHSKLKGEKTLETLEKVSLRTGEAFFKLKDASHGSWERMLFQDPLDDIEISRLAVNTYHESRRLIGQAHSLAALLNNRELTAVLKVTDDKLYQIYQCMALDNMLIQTEELNVKTLDCESSFDDCFTQIAKAFENA